MEMKFLFVQEEQIDEIGDENRSIGLYNLANRKRILLAKGHSPMITPNGKYIVYGYNYNVAGSLLHIMTVNGKNDRLLIDGDRRNYASSTATTLFSTTILRYG